jgi:hypothetical protein
MNRRKFLALLGIGVALRKLTPDPKSIPNPAWVNADYEIWFVGLQDYPGAPMKLPGWQAIPPA